ncbi:MAG: hypothetical protein ACXV4B_06065 [Halobacteriota archaeon]
MAEGVTLTTGVGVTLTTGEGVGVTLTRGVAVGEGVTLTRGVAVGEGVSVAFAPAAWYGSKQSAVDEATAIRITKDSTATREMRILDPPACNDNY